MKIRIYRNDVNMASGVIGGTILNEYDRTIEIINRIPTTPTELIKIFGIVNRFNYFDFDYVRENGEVKLLTAAV